MTTNTIILDAARAWRHARDHRQPIQRTIYQSLDRHHCGILTPVIHSLLSLYEACSGRRFHVGDTTQVAISADERRLLSLLRGADGGDAAVLDASAIPSLAPVLRIALRSTRIMLRLALESVGASPPPGFGQRTVTSMLANDAQVRPRHAC